MQMYELSDNELTLYMCHQPIMDGVAGAKIQYRNFKFIRVEVENE